MDTKKMAAGLAALVGIGATALGVASVKPATAQVARPFPPTMRRGNGNRAHAERHPEIRAARRNLEQAKNNLQRASHDFSGHREKALDLVQRAISECDQALQGDKH